MRIDGLLVFPLSATKNIGHFKKFKTGEFLLVVFDRDCSGLEVDKVLVDDYDGALQAVE